MLRELKNLSVLKFYTHIVNRPLPIKAPNKAVSTAPVTEAQPKNEFALIKQTILELLGELGTVTPEIKEIITKQNDLATLQAWNKLAARSNTLEEFESQI